MRIVKCNDYDKMSQCAANIIASQMILKPDSVLGLATGSSPVGTYKCLIDMYNNEDITFKEITSINLDEYVGLGSENDQSYKYFMMQHLFNHVDMNEKNINVPNGLEKDTAFECERYDSVIENAGGIDLQLLGIGHNGHIGFNEPCDTFKKNTNCVCLTQTTIDANRRFFQDEKDVPRKAYTMGIGSIFGAKKILMVVSGKDKSEVVKRAFFGPITPEVPASILQLHQDFILVGDQDALCLV